MRCLADGWAPATPLHHQVDHHGPAHADGPDIDVLTVDEDDPT